MPKRDLTTDFGRYVNSATGRILDDAFSDGIDNPIIHGGMLATGVEQGIFEQSATQNYTIGTKMILPDQRCEPCQPFLKPSNPSSDGS